MNWTLTDVTYLILPILLFLGSNQDQTPVFDRLRGNFEDGKVFTANFSHQYMDDYTGEETATDGTIWIGSGKYKVESEEHVLVVNGDVSRVYDGIRNRLLISRYEEEEDDFAPSRMLQGVDDSYNVEEESESEGTRITLENDDPFAMFKRVEIHVNSNGIPVEIHATDQADNRLTTRFENGEFIQDDPSLFELTVPEGAERVDLRH